MTVSSEKLEATTMVIVSDLDVIAKCSRNELFVFAENVADRKPAAGTKLLISDGSRIFAEEQTDKEGILEKLYDQLKKRSRTCGSSPCGRATSPRRSTRSKGSTSPWD